MSFFKRLKTKILCWRFGHKMVQGPWEPTDTSPLSFEYETAVCAFGCGYKWRARYATFICCRTGVCRITGKTS